jgi:transposase-like protein
LAFGAFPLEHWRKLWSTNPSSACTGRSSGAVTWWRVFPNDAAIDQASVGRQESDSHGASTMTVVDQTEVGPGRRLHDEADEAGSDVLR